MASNLSFDSLNGDEFYYTFQSPLTQESSNSDRSFQSDAIDEINARNSPDFELESNDFTPQVISEYTILKSNSLLLILQAIMILRCCT